MTLLVDWVYSSAKTDVRAICVDAIHAITGTNAIVVSAAVSSTAVFLSDDSMTLVHI